MPGSMYKTRAIMPFARSCAAAAGCASLLMTATGAHARTHTHTNPNTKGDLASFYSRDRSTASGQRFDKTALKAAHRTLPFGSIVKVVNRLNGRSVVIEINDRGPANWTGRAIDLTRGAAEQIGMIRRGVVPVRLEVAHLTRRQLNRAFLKLARLLDAKAVVAAREEQAQAEMPAKTEPPVVLEVKAMAAAREGEAQAERLLEANAMVAAREGEAQAERPLEANAMAAAPEAQAQAATPATINPRVLPLAPAVATEVMRPLQMLGNIFTAYVQTMIVAAGPHVRLYCPDGQPLPEALRAVLRRAASEFSHEVEVISGYRSLAYNRAIYGNRRKRRGEYVGDGSQHIRCRAADIRIAGVSTAALHAWALRQPELGGVGRYRGDFIHVDIRPRTDGRIVAWDWRAKPKYARRHQHRHHHYTRYARA